MADSMRDRFVDGVGGLLDSDENVAVVLAVISAGLFRDRGVTARHPDRIIDVGIREQAQIGVAGGLALEGFLPIVTGYAPFLVERPFEQIKLSLGHQGVRAILASVGASWDSAGSGRTHQAPEDVALMTTLPGWEVHIPGHPDELGILLDHAHRSDDSTYLRMTVDANRMAYTTTPGRLVTLRRGSPDAATVLAIGPVADAVLAATADLDVTVLYTSTVAPIDRRGLRASLLGDEILIVEPYLAGTTLRLVNDALSDRPTLIRSHGVRDTELRHYGSPTDHRSAHGLDPVGIRTAVMAMPAVELRAVS